MKTPDYYVRNGIEAMDVVLAFSPDNYNVGTALTYLMRAGKKPDNSFEQDVRKAIAHLEAELKREVKKPCETKDKLELQKIYFKLELQKIYFKLYDELPEDVAEKAKKNWDYTFCNGYDIPLNKEEAVECGFSWGKTKEGGIYWAKISDNLWLI